MPHFVVRCWASPAVWGHSRLIESTNFPSLAGCLPPLAVGFSCRRVARPEERGIRLLYGGRFLMPPFGLGCVQTLFMFLYMGIVGHLLSVLSRGWCWRLATLACLFGYAWCRRIRYGAIAERWISPAAPFAEMQARQRVMEFELFGARSVRGRMFREHGGCMVAVHGSTVRG